MHYLLHYQVAPDFERRRGSCRDEHLARAWDAARRGELVLAGALADPVDGAVLLFEAASPEVAERFARSDPYVRNGLVLRWTVRPWTTVVGESASNRTRPEDLTGREAGSAGAPTGAPRIWFGGATPVLHVRDLAASVAFYEKVLGFRLDFSDPGIFASVSRGHCTVFLCEGDQGHPGTWLYVGVGDVEALFEEFRGKGATIRQPPTNHPWACEMQVEDPDGHVLRFGSDPRPDLPAGEWLDMRGVRWSRSPAGGWTRVEPG